VSIYFLFSCFISSLKSISLNKIIYSSNRKNTENKEKPATIPSGRSAKTPKGSAKDKDKDKDKDSKR
jgi:hypothetical protein